LGVAEAAAGRRRNPSNRATRYDDGITVAAISAQRNATATLCP
jgi:hypothetical protein